MGFIAFMLFLVLAGLVGEYQIVFSTLEHLSHVNSGYAHIIFDGLSHLLTVGAITTLIGIIVALIVFLDSL